MADPAKSAGQQEKRATGPPSGDRPDTGPTPPKAAAAPPPAAADAAFFAPRPWLAARADGWLSASDKAPLLVLRGPAGSGKTRFVYHWAAAVRKRGRLAALISQDAQAEPADPFAWPVLRDQLMELARPGSRADAGGAPAGAGWAAAATTEQVVGDLVVGCATDPVQELETVVLPALGKLPAGAPVVIAVDGVDEAARCGRHDFLAVVASLADHLRSAARGRSGLGRCRLVVTARPETPLDLGPAADPVVIDLAEPDPADREDLREYVRALLGEIGEPRREELAGDIVEQAGGVWAVARYLACGLWDDAVADGAASSRPDVLSLDQAYAASLDRARACLGPDWDTARTLLGVVAAAQDIGTALPRDVAAGVLGDGSSDLDGLLAGLGTLITTGPDGTLRFAHSDLGWWVIDGNAGEAAVPDAHDRLAAVLLDQGGADWAKASPYCLGYVALHALAAAELSARKPARFPKLVNRCLALFADDGRLHADPDPLSWLGQLTGLSGLCRADTRLAGSTEPVTGLAARLTEALGPRVGELLAARLTDEQAADLDAIAAGGDEPSVLAWVRGHVPDYRSVVTGEFLALFETVLAGARLPRDPGASSARRAEDYAQAWRETQRTEYLDAAITAWQEAVAQTEPDDLQRTDRLIGLANALIDRVNSSDQPSDLDLLLDAQRQLAGRSDLENQAQAQAQAIYAATLHRRWQRDPSAHPGDLDAAVKAWDEALSRTGMDERHRTGRLIGLADALGDRVNSAEQEGDLDQLLAAWAEVAGRDDLADHVADPGQSWAVCASWLVRSWQRDPADRSADLDAAVTAWQMALRQAPHGHPERTARLIGLADALGERIRAGGEHDGDMDRLLNSWAEVVGQEDLADPGQSWATYAAWLVRSWRRDQVGHIGDLDAAVTAWQVALSHAPDGHAERTRRLAGLANALIARVGTAAQDDNDLDQLIDVQRELVSRDDVARPGQSWAVYAVWLGKRWEGDPAASPGDLDAAVDAWQQALAQTPADDAHRSGRLIGLANTLGDRIDSSAERDDDLDRLLATWAEVAERDDLADQVSDVGRAWGIYGGWLVRRWQRDPAEHVADLEASIPAWQKAVAAAPDSDPDRTRRLAGLARVLAAQADADAATDANLDLLVDVQRELAEREDLADHVGEIYQFQADRARYLHRRWQVDHSGHAADLEAAVTAWEEALDGAPNGHPERPRRLIGLATALADRISSKAEQDGDLDRVIGTWAEALGASELDDPGQTWAGYAAALYRRWQRDPEAHSGDLDTAVTAWEEAVAESPAGQTGRGACLAGLARALGNRVGSEVEQDGDLDRLIDVQRELVHRDDLADPGQAWATYATWLDRRREHRSGQWQLDVYQASQAWEQAIGHTSEGHAERTARLAGLAGALTVRVESGSEQDGDLDRLIDVQRELVRRPELPAPGPGPAWAAFATWLLRRWRRDPAARPGDLDDAISAWQECLRATAPGQAGRAVWLAEAANADMLGSVNGTQHADLNRAVRRAAEVLKSADPAGRAALLPSLARLARMRS
jgi:tetratricopeptide (TPR) repeat protein